MPARGPTYMLLYLPIYSTHTRVTTYGKNPASKHGRHDRMSTHGHCIGMGCRPLINRMNPLPTGVAAIALGFPKPQKAKGAGGGAP
jgi:hypothetical protein